MILDEATANIDTETEILIQDSLEKMRSVGTMLIVAHRLSTIQHADNIIVLSHGRILEQGSHQELLAKHGRYYQLYTLQYHKEQLEGKGLKPPPLWEGGPAGSDERPVCHCGLFMGSPVGRYAPMPPLLPLL